MVIENNLIHFNEQKEFDKAFSNEEIKDTSIVFINDSRKINTHKSQYKTITWGRLKSKIYYTTNDGNIINVHDYWKTAENGKYWPIENYYDKEKNQGVMVFEECLFEIPGINGHPFLYSQDNLLTLKLPKTIKKLNRGCFYGCSNLYQVNVEDLISLEELGLGPFELTSINKLDFRRSKLTTLEAGAFTIRDKTIVDYILCPESILYYGEGLFNYNNNDLGTRIKTVMIPSMPKYNNFRVENIILENLIINKFDGIADLHFFNTDCVIWVPDEWYDKYIEYYTNNNDYQNWQNIIKRLKKYSEGVPEFPSK